MSSSILVTNGVVLATAMAAGTAIFIAFCLQKQLSSPGTGTGTDQLSVINLPRPCISSDGKKKVKKKKKNVKFAEDVMEPSGNGDEFRKRLKSKKFNQNRNNLSILKDEGGQKKLSRSFKALPANRMALYSGILRDRGRVHRHGYSY